MIAFATLRRCWVRLWVAALLLAVSTALAHAAQAGARLVAQSASPITNAKAMLTRNVCVVEVADLTPDTLTTDRYGLVGHDLRSHSQTVRLARLDGHAKVGCVTEFGG